MLLQTGHHELHGDGHGVGNAAGLDDDVLRGCIAPEKVGQRRDDAALHRAADAAALNPQHVGVLMDNKISIDVQVAEVVDTDGDAAIRKAAEQVVEQRRFAASQKPGKKSYRDGGRRRFGHGNVWLFGEAAGVRRLRG
jgi:hypothetical protein